ncbi:hypothetical protein [Roseomonas sp. AR75]|uniref:hypothetical protein n=1 Tax=Roseomonas sp. AR75 TaxID=2562311 RepID=UPI0010C0B088|nr:hypothetical protein [Roseomonas sp. AR75]
MAGAAAAGALYFAVLFGLGFLLGPFRILVLEPRIGAVGAILVEAVPMLGAMIVVAPWAARMLDVPPTPAARLTMGIVALLLLVAAESALDALLGGRAFWAQRVRTPDGRIGLTLMAAFALMPLVRRRA